jgi:hypothetical protein
MSQSIGLCDSTPQLVQKVNPHLQVIVSGKPNSALTKQLHPAAGHHFMFLLLSVNDLHKYFVYFSYASGLQYFLKKDLGICIKHLRKGQRAYTPSVPLKTAASQAPFQQESQNLCLHSKATPGFSGVKVS